MSAPASAVEPLVNAVLAEARRADSWALLGYAYFGDHDIDRGLSALVISEILYERERLVSQHTPGFDPPEDLRRTDKEGRSRQSLRRQTGRLVPWQRRAIRILEAQAQLLSATMRQAEVPDQVRRIAQQNPDLTPGGRPPTRPIQVSARP